MFLRALVFPESELCAFAPLREIIRADLLGFGAYPAKAQRRQVTRRACHFEGIIAPRSLQRHEGSRRKTAKAQGTKHSRQIRTLRLDAFERHMSENDCAMANEF